MKSRGSVLTAAALVCAFAWTSGCEGPEGPQGLAGPAGRDGTNGTNGAAGLPGDAGPAGPQGPPGDAGVQGPAGDGGVTPLLRLLDQRVRGWVAANRTRLDQLLRTYGASSLTFDPALRPVAVFDWDNTVLKNDIGDATLFWMIKNDKILQPTGGDWATTSPALTPAAVAVLNAACGSLSSPGQPVPTSANSACATAIVSIYNDFRTPGASTNDAWTPASATTTTMQTAYAWVSQLQAGYRPDEIRVFAYSAFEENNAAPIGTTQAIGTFTSLNGYVRIYEPIRDLIGALRDNGFDVWVLTASPQYVVEGIAEEVGVHRDHVVGIRPVLSQGRITTTFQGCGSVPDGNTTLITFDEGKRCWINKAIFRLSAADQPLRQTDLRKRPVFSAGDSDTDIAMLKDASALKLVINRGKVQTMCNAIANSASAWIYQPMFISPRATRTTPYACSTALDNGGVNRIVDETGAVFPSDLSEVAQTPEP